MKKLSSMLALGLALALTFGMTVCAADSPEASLAVEEAAEKAGFNEEKAAAFAEGVSVEAVTVGDKTIVPTVTPVNPTTLYAANEAAKTLFDGGKAVASVNISLGGESGEVTLTIDMGAKVEAGKKYVLLHWDGDKWETIVPKSIVGGKVTATFSNLSPVILVEDNRKDGEQADWPEPRHPENAAAAAATAAAGPATSPKTAETFPAAGVLAVFCLAGAAVCARRMRCSK